MNVKKVINGREYDFVYPDSWYLADCICKRQNNDYELTAKKGGFVAEIYKQDKKSISNFYDSEHKVAVPDKNKKQQCLGWLIWNPETNQIVFRKTSVDSEKHEYHREDCLAVSYDVFSQLRDGDIIQIHGEELDKDGNSIPTIFRIKKYKAAKFGEFKQFIGYGLQYFIPKSAFFKAVDTTKLRMKPKKKKKSKVKISEEKKTA